MAKSRREQIFDAGELPPEEELTDSSTTPEDLLKEPKAPKAQAEPSAEAKPVEEPQARLSNLKPGDRRDVETPSGKRFTFILPDAESYRRLVPNRELVIRGEGMETQTRYIEPVLLEFCEPRPDPRELTPGEWDFLVLSFWAFLLESMG